LFSEGESNNKRGCEACRNFSEGDDGGGIKKGDKIKNNISFYRFVLFFLV